MDAYRIDLHARRKDLAPQAPEPGAARGEPIVYVVDDDAGVRQALCWLIESVRLKARCFPSVVEFLDAVRPGTAGCLVLDVRMPGMSGMELLERLASLGLDLPVILLSGHGTIPMATRAMRLGAVDFIQKPLNEELLLKRIHEALALSATRLRHRTAAERLAALTAREREVIDLVATGKYNKDVARALDLSLRTVEAHRARAMHKLGVGNVAELVTLLGPSPDPRRR